MKKEELIEIYTIEKVSGKKFLTDIYKVINEKHKYFLLLFINYLVYQIAGTRLTGSVYEKFGLWIYLLYYAFSLIIIAYMVFSLTETNQRVYSSSRFNKAICTIWTQIKTFLCEMVYAMLYVFIISIVLTILFLVFMWATKIEDVYAYSMGFAVVIGVIVILVMTQFLYATYIAIITDEEGFDAVRLSQMIFNRNKLKTILLFFVQIGFPMITYLSMEYLKIPIQYNLIINFINSLVSFLVLTYIANFIPKVMVYNPGKIENIIEIIDTE